jgi:hypothetical protein
MVPPPRNYAADAHECIMGSGRKARRIQGCGAMIGRPRQVPLAIFASPNRWPLRGLRTSSSGANPHERRASSSVENPPEREGAHAHVRLDEGARPVDERRPLSSCAWEGRKIKREMGVISSAADRRRWPDPCKGWRRVGAKDYSFAPLTEPDMRATHPALWIDISEVQRELDRNLRRVKVVPHSFERGHPSGEPCR